MDFSKAKTILIIALIITDLFLIFTYGIDRDNSTALKNETALISILESNEIIVDADIPGAHEEMPVLSVEYKDISKQEIDALITDADITAEKKTQQGFENAAKEFVNYLGMMSTYIYVQEVAIDQAADTARVVFACRADDFCVDGSYMICSFTGDKLTGFESHWLEPGDFSDKELETISAAVALLSFMSEKDDDREIHIKDIEMVYWVNDLYETSDAVYDTALPAWRITLEDGETVHIEAFEREGRSE